MGTEDNHIVQANLEPDCGQINSCFPALPNISALMVKIVITILDMVSKSEQNEVATKTLAATVSVAQQRLEGEIPEVLVEAGGNNCKIKSP